MKKESTVKKSGISAGPQAIKPPAGPPATRSPKRVAAGNEQSAPKGSLLGKLSVEQFLQRYWQRKPLVVRGAVPEMQSRVLVSPEVLFEHAASDDVESRLVSQRRERWSVDFGPFETLPSTRTRNWTVLVQGMDLVDDAAHDILQRFRFIPDARLDDVMISFATIGGGVGPHTDSYDVFLLQASGRRRWGIGPAPRPQWVEGLPLRILRDWQPTEHYDLEPGDLLYVPPGWGHDGVALDACTTWSIGFRTPSRQEFLSAWLGDRAEQAADLAGTPRDERFRDPKRAPTQHPARVPDDLRATLHAWVQAWRSDSRAIETSLDAFIGRHLSEPKAHVFFEAPHRPISRARFLQQASRHGVALDRRARLLYDQRHLFMNGELDNLSPNPALRLFANQRGWGAQQAATSLVNESILEGVYSWYLAGWVRIRPAQQDTD